MNIKEKKKNTLHIPSNWQYEFFDKKKKRIKQVNEKREQQKKNI